MLSDQTNYSDLKNALLYADSVFWFSSEMLSASVWKNHTITEIVDLPKKPLPSRESIFDPKAFFSSSRSLLGLLGMRDSPVPDSPIPSYQQMLDEIKSSGGDGLLFPATHSEEMVNLDVNGRILKLLPKFVKGVERSKCIIGAPRNPDEPWNAYKATVELQSAVSNLLLPDVSDLPLSEIFEIRDRTRDMLDPMRAELLRFTEILRQMVKDARNDPDSFRHEAENLVRTRIEPVVREAGHRTRQLAEQKWRKLFTGAAKVLGLTTASLIDPKLYAKAVAQTVETGALAFQSPEDKGPDPRVTAQFVLEAHSFLAAKGE